MKSKFAGLLTLFLLIAPGQLRAQGLFEAFGFPRTITATGHTEVIGSILVSLRQGTSAAGTLVVDVSPLRITNTAAADIRVVTTGNVAVGALTVDAEKGQARIPVLAGATSGSIRVEGIRVSAAGTGISSLNARLYWESSLNILTSGTNLIVVNAVQSGLAADKITDHFVVFNGQVFDSTSTITLREGYAAAFSNSTEFGQTAPTRIRIRVTDFTTGVRMTFPAAVPAPNTGAALTTGGGGAVTLAADGSTEVTYSFSGASTSNDTVETFDIPFTVSVAGPVGSTQPTIEVSLSPAGAAVPDSVFPSTGVPRYAAEEIVVLEGTSRIITKVQYWTGIDTSLQNQVTFLNPSSGVSNLTIDALNSSGQAISGTGVTNPVKLSLSANQSVVRTLPEFFGTSAGIASIRVQSTGGVQLLAAAQVSGAGKSELVPFLSQALFSVFVPVAGDAGQLHLLNPNSTQATGTLTLRTAQGSVVSSAGVVLAPLASTSVTLASAFNNPAGGYVFGNFTNPVVAFESFGDSNALTVSALRPPASAASLFIPFFAVGNGFQTDVNLINVSGETVTLKAQLFDAAGSQVGPAVLITMPANEQVDVPVQTVFTSLSATGYIRIDPPRLSRGFFSFYPAITGQARLRSSQGGSTVIPLSAQPLSDSFILGSGTAANEFQGIALVNPTASAVAVNLQAMSPNGTVLSNTMLTLNPGQVVSRLTTEFFSSGVPAQSVIRVTSSAPIVATAITGSTSLDMLRSLPALR